MNRVFQSGEVIKARVTEAPFIFHYGIIVYCNEDVYILHNPFMIGPSIDTVSDFFKNRYFVKSYGKLINESDEQILAKFNSIKDRKYSTFKFNCEDFVNVMIGYLRFQSGKIQLMFVILITFILIVIALNSMINQKKTA